MAARPGIVRLMAEAQAAGVPVAVCSAATKSAVVFVLENLLGKVRRAALRCGLRCAVACAALRMPPGRRAPRMAPAPAGAQPERAARACTARSSQPACVRLPPR